jgi:hypothetical protein
MTQLMSVNANNLFGESIIPPLNYAAWAIVWWVWFGRMGPRWFPRLVAGITVSLIICWALSFER